MDRQPKAILLDALGTLIGFEPPAPNLQAELHARGYEVTLAAATSAIRAEIAYYRAHLDEGRDAGSLRDLRERCAAAMEPELPDVPHDAILDALLAALRFFAYPDTVPALTALRAAGIRLVVVSNWDHSLHERLSETGLTPLLDGAIASAEVGAAKPSPVIFARALELAGTTEAWHVGDTPEADLDGARAAGLPGILIDRGDARLAARVAGSPRPGARTSRVASETTVVGSLLELIPLAVPR